MGKFPNLNPVRIFGQGRSMGEAVGSSMASAMAASDDLKGIHRMVVLNVHESSYPGSRTGAINESAGEDAPRGTLTVRPVADPDGDSFVVLPFFSSHFGLPVKEQEHVWVMYEDINHPDPPYMNAKGYWLSRIVGTERTENVNLTVAGREWQSPVSLADRAGGAAGQLHYTFPDGVVGSGGSDGAGDAGTGLTTHYSSIPVPPWVKRKGDTVLQGSHNTVVSLGEDTAARRSMGSGAGAIDIVAGRGHYVAVLNDRGTAEYGFPGARFRRGQDFSGDLSRVYVSMATLPDNFFVPTAPTLAGVATNLDLRTGFPEPGFLSHNVDFDDSNIGAGTVVNSSYTGEGGGISFRATSAENQSEYYTPAAVVKSDHVRIMARRSLRLGVENGAEIILGPNGNIFIKPGFKTNSRGQLMTSHPSADPTLPPGQHVYGHGKVYLGGGPDEAGDASFADMLTYPPDDGFMLESGVDPQTAFYSEQFTVNKIPEGGLGSGESPWPRHSAYVKVKTTLDPYPGSNESPSE